MSAVTKHERPGVYSSYEASSLTAAALGGGSVAVVAAHDGADGKESYQWTSYSRAAADVGDCTLSRMAQLAIRNGAGVVYGVPAGEDYAQALATVAAMEDVGIVVCDSAELTVQQALKAMVQECSAARRERIAVVGGAAGESVEQLVGRAAQLNCERMVLVAPGAGDGSGGAMCAAAAAGAIAGGSDPALPLGGAQLYGLSGLEASYDDGDIDLLVQGGVTPLETLAGACYVVRGVTTRTKTGGAVDATWRELTTILVVDEVIPGIRNALRAKFSRAKNTTQSRGAIRSQTVMELEKRVAREIIDSYEDVTVSALEDDPTVCLVEFAFTVAHGLNQIWLSAHITV
ncbi:MAG: phage tail sheath protein [Clostridiales bacterium]|nr:phage tail sheath protein [Clostridiales bacterium]